MYPCVCCGYLTLSEEPGSYEICSICFWEDDETQLIWPETGGGANKVSLVEAQQNYEKLGVSEPRLRQFVRPPTSGEGRDPGWRPIDMQLDDFASQQGLPWPEDGTVLYWWRPTSQVSRGE